MRLKMPPVEILTRSVVYGGVFVIVLFVGAIVGLGLYGDELESSSVQRQMSGHWTAECYLGGQWLRFEGLDSSIFGSLDNPAYRFERNGLMLFLPKAVCIVTEGEAE